MFVDKLHFSAQLGTDSKIDTRSTPFEVSGLGSGVSRIAMGSVRRQLGFWLIAGIFLLTLLLLDSFLSFVYFATAVASAACIIKAVNS